MKRNGPFDCATHISLGLIEEKKMCNSAVKLLLIVQRGSQVFSSGGTGPAYPYEGGRFAGDIVEFMKSVADGSWKPPRDRVVTLTEATFSKFIKENPNTMVEFYAPWCGHCQ